MKTVKKLKKLYVGRVRRSEHSYEIGRDKKGFSETFGFHDKYFLGTFCKNDFERVTGISLEPGEVQRVEIIIRPYGEVCKWRYIGYNYVWRLECGGYWMLKEDTPEGNGVDFCPRCGKPVKEVKG